MHTPTSDIRTATFKTLGCRLNQAEMDALAFKLASRGIRVRPFGEPVDLTVINTCTVTHDADKDSRYAIRQAIRKSPEGRVVVTGCYAQMSPEAVRAIDGVDLVLGNDEKMRLVEYLENPPIPPLKKGGQEGISDRTRANLKIQDGCDYHCSFCIIPFARGRARSVPFKEVVQEAKDLIARGFKEIVLTGVNIGTYLGEDDGAPKRFADLVDDLQNIDGLARLRISSIEPNTVTDRLLKVMSRSKAVCPHLHIPIQSASDTLLAGMRRKYRRARLARRIERIRAAMPEAAIGTDVIVGFPGETDALFEETLHFVETAGFSYVHVFPFSAREGTAASKMADAVPSEIIHRRVSVLRELSIRLRDDFAKRFAGRALPVLFEEPEGEFQTGLTPNFIRVKVESARNLRNQIKKIMIHPDILSPLSHHGGEGSGEGAST